MQRKSSILISHFHICPCRKEYLPPLPSCLIILSNYSTHSQKNKNVVVKMHTARFRKLNKSIKWLIPGPPQERCTYKPEMHAVQHKVIPAWTLDFKVASLTGITIISFMTHSSFGQRFLWGLNQGVADTVPERKRDGHTGKLCEGVDHHLRPHSQHRFWGWLHIDTISLHQKTILNESLKHPRSRKPNPAAQESYEGWINSWIQAITVFVKLCLCLPFPSLTSSTM